MFMFMFNLALIERLANCASLGFLGLVLFPEDVSNDRDDDEDDNDDRNSNACFGACGESFLFGIMGSISALDKIGDNRFDDVVVRERSHGV